jgi:lysozyme
MTISEKGLQFIRDHEGCILHAYLDGGGVPTIGYGTTRYANGSRVQIGEVITKEQAENYLYAEARAKAIAVNEATKSVTLNQNQFDALVSLAYNIGVGAFRRSTLLKDILIDPTERPTIDGAFEMWKYDNGKVIPGLLARRKEEVKLYFS